ncbi:MAG: hypothetical protein RLZZ265_3095 [Verrucomicrobiota bacterium]|jgi:hypothetical protein
MIPWFQCTAFELKAIANLPNKLRKRFVAARELQLVRELETLPGFTESELIDLESTGIATRLEIMCPRLLKERDRQVRKKTKEDETATRVTPVSDPVPTRVRPVQRERQSREEKTEQREAGAPAKPAKATRATSIPKDWKPSATHREKAASLSLIVDSEAEQFRLSAEAKGRVYASWDAAFHTWLNNAARWRDERNAPKQAAPRPVVKGWDDGDTWLGIPKGGTR